MMLLLPRIRSNGFITLIVTRRRLSVHIRVCIQTWTMGLYFLLLFPNDASVSWILVLQSELESRCPGDGGMEPSCTLLTNEWQFQNESNWLVSCLQHGAGVVVLSCPAWSWCTSSQSLWGCRCLTARLVKSDGCLHLSQLLKSDEGKQVMQIGLETACWHLTSGMVIKNTLWQRQHLAVRSERQWNSSEVRH